MNIKALSPKYVSKLLPAYCSRAIYAILTIVLLFSELVVLPMKTEKAAAQGLPERMPRLLKDINSLPIGSYPMGYLEYHDLMFFEAYAPRVGQTIWRSDGTDAGTTIVKGIPPNINRSLIVYHDFLYFVSNYGNGNQVYALWKSDGSDTGTHPVKQLSTVGYTDDFTICNDLLFFFSKYNGSVEWFRSDGTPEGTWSISTFASGGNFPSYSIGCYNDWLYFGKSKPTDKSKYDLWRTDGSVANTQLVKSVELPSVGTMVVMGNYLYFIASNGTNGTELWRSDGTSDGTAMVADIAVGSASSTPQNLFVWKGVLYFFASNASTGREPWRSDGTSAGTWRLKDIAPGSSDSSIGYLFFVPFGSHLYFSASSGSPGAELWRTDGTSLGTVLAYNSCPEICNSNIGFTDAIVVDNKLYFLTPPKLNEPFLWILNSSEDAPTFLRDLPARISYNSWKDYQGKLYFRGYTKETGSELWSTDGTMEGTSLVKDLHPGTNGSGQFRFVHAIDDSLFFGLQNQNEADLWQINVTTFDTKLVKDWGTSGPGLMTPPVSFQSSLYYYGCEPKLHANGNCLFYRWHEGLEETLVLEKDYFAYFSPAFGELFLTNNGSNLYTVKIKDDPSGSSQMYLDSVYSGGYIASDVKEFNQKAYFLSLGNDTLQLLQYDGERTESVVTQECSESAPNYGLIATMGQNLIFSGCSLEYGMELYQTDGSAAGTKMLGDYSPGAAHSAPVEVLAAGEWLYASLYFSDFTGAVVRTHGVVDGISTGFETIRKFVSPAGYLQRLKNLVFFLAPDASPYTYYLWQTDIVTGETKMVQPENGSFLGVGEFVILGDRVFFTAEDTEHGREIWSTDGTPQGTRLEFDLFPGPTGSFPQRLTVVQNLLYFAADDGLYGNELWVYEPFANRSPTDVQLSSTIFPENSVNALIGTLAVTDPDEGDTATCALDPSSPAGFAVTDNVLYAVEAQDFEAGPGQFDLSITCHDAGGLAITKTLAVQVGNVNEAPVSIGFSHNAFPENSADTLIGTLTVTDPDEGDTSTCTLDDSSPLGFAVTDNKLYATDARNFEDGPTTFDLSLTCQDAGGLAITRAFSVQVENVNEAPVSLTLEQDIFPENSANILIGNLSVTDPDAGDTVTCSLDSSSADGFKVISNALYAAEARDFERSPNQFELPITCHDAGGLAIKKSFVVPVHDVNEVPSFAQGESQSISLEEDSGAYRFDLQAADPDAGTELTWSITQQPAKGSLRLTGLGSTRAVEYQPEANQYGSDSFVLQVSDGELTASYTASIQIKPLNDAPTLDPVPNLTVDFRSPVQSIDLTGISAGPLEGEAVSITTTTDRPDLLLDVKIIDFDGDRAVLTFQPSGREPGTAAVTVIVDDGQAKTERKFIVTLNGYWMLYLPVTNHKK